MAEQPETHQSISSSDQSVSHDYLDNQIKGLGQSDSGSSDPVRSEYFLTLILKLAALIFLFNQDGSKQRLAFLIFFAFLIYLYQTEALAPVIRWLSQGMHRAAARRQPARAAGRPDDFPAGGAPGNEDVDIAGERPVVENQNQQANDGNVAMENENARELAQGEAGNRWHAVLKEIQLFIFGFITSLLPGFHNID